MANADHSEAGEPGKPASRKNEIDPAVMAEFTKAIEAFRKASSDGHGEQAEAAALQMLSLAAQEAERNPTPELELAVEAGECEARGAWDDADAIYRRLLAMAEASDAPSQQKFGRMFKVHRDRGSLFVLRSEYAQAHQTALAALAAARLADLQPLLVWALEFVAYCALRVQDLAGALAAANEAVGVIIEPEAIFDNLRAMAWVSRARCRVAAGDCSGAEEDLAQSQPLVFRKGIFDWAAGLHSQAALWWEVRANLCERQEQWRDAVEAWRQAVACRRHVSSLPHVQGPHRLGALAGTLLRLGRALQECGDVPESERILAEGEKIWRELGLPAQAAL
jgi:hypothetical protein